MSESVKVAVRCRPMSQKELQQKCRSVVTVDSGARSCSLSDASGGPASGGKVYQFDAAFGPQASTEAVYEEVGSYVVEAVLEGYNGTVFAYGQTGCGKSHTMRGFIERALEHLFEATSTASQDTRYLALLTYLEIYNEKLRDLLQSHDHHDGQLQLKEDPVRGTYVAGGLREVTVKDARECTRLVELGDRRRAAAATKMNAASSRSHAVLTVSLEAIAIGANAGGASAVRRGRLHLVDLAGSERQGRTGATGDRLKEAASINLSLSALGNVISALAAGNGRHVPYRDSKLTRLLRDSLGGNARTLMIACVSPSDADAEETLSTLRYAARARCIKNKPVVNEDPKDALLRQYQLELQRLRKLLESSESSRDSSGCDGDEVERLRRECEHSTSAAQRLQEEVRSLRSQCQSGAANVLVIDSSPSKSSEEALDPERAERRQRKREAAKQEVLKRLERLTIGGEALGDVEIRRRRERRRKRLQALAEALERSSQEGTGCAFEVYGQLKSTEEALKKMAKRAKQLEAEVADMQASWDEERHELLRRELLTQQICEAMMPHLRPGCPLRDIAAIRAAASWCTELGRWRLPDISSRVPLPPAAALKTPPPAEPKADVNNNNNVPTASGGNDASLDEESAGEERETNIADVYFKRSRVDKILQRVREVKSFDTASRLSRSGGSSEEPQPLASSQLALQQPVQLGSLGTLNGASTPPRLIGAWVQSDDVVPTTINGDFFKRQQQQQQQQQQQHPRILEALHPASHRLPNPIS
ncbi:osmotic avoidance abnormal protein 3-like [Phymastichus coffea]|uniref:osmotic avoidance abnormal protein 3-like n=1 Tax=Phymastichus coffea TaxID=108790 RepID=UPI00273A7EDB|nr:osmotic avoidance abnormal protein 3-like [Phymastichus coffea]